MSEDLREEPPFCWCNCSFVKGKQDRVCEKRARRERERERELRIHRTTQARQKLIVAAEVQMI